MENDFYCICKNHIRITTWHLGTKPFVVQGLTQHATARVLEDHLGICVTNSNFRVTIRQENHQQRGH